MDWKVSWFYFAHWVFSIASFELSAPVGTDDFSDQGFEDFAARYMIDLSIKLMSYAAH